MTRDFRLLAAGQTLSWLGTGFQTVALAVAVFAHGGSVRDLGLVMAASVLTMLAGTLFGGVWADRLQPRHVMVVSDVIRMLSTAGLALMFRGGGYHLGALCALTVVSAGAGAFFTPAMSALKPLLVPAVDLQRANATLSMLQTGCGVAGPVLGGLVVAAVGAPAGFAVNSVSFLASLVTAALIRVRVERGPHEPMLRELGAGWQAIRSRDWLLGGMLSATVYHVANGIILVLVPLIAWQRLGGAHAIGWISGAEGLGGLLGSALALRVRPRRLLRAGWLTLMLMPFWALSYVWPGRLTAVLAGAIVGYGGLMFFAVAWETAIQDRVPRTMLGRVASWDYLTSFLAMPVGNALAGPLTARFGVDRVLVACAFVLFAAAASPLLIRGSRDLTRSAEPAGVAAHA
ncbi:MFS transporter [Actinoplanes sp. SE50]|uniref:MFS transporter n=1 Tax=unclassified Actinoplanes TaxID=2626549 RepID=UPI00023EC755|nr:MULTISPECIES: MFS transporter [unclassified Actinoplanes]AEV82564.1 Putative bacilysin exporter bacE [Actinoplanes sp. SE50/110]ATO80960.1 MFS transporter [Actinoplanes sp. SE50]SLL98367.1 MFS transporter [Actinoplanes sp. SE50/110]